MIKLMIGNYTDFGTGSWKKQVNRFLHFSTASNNSGPGSIYLYSSFLEGNSICYFNDRGPATNISIINEECIRDNYIQLVEDFSFSEKESKHKISMLDYIRNSTCVITNITPPCDHAQNKALWLKFCGGLCINLDGASSAQLKVFDKIFSGPEYLWNSCDFSFGVQGQKHNRLIFNSKLIFSCSDNDKIKDKLILASVSKMREQITRDLTHWLGRQLTRPGYTYM